MGHFCDARIVKSIQEKQRKVIDLVHQLDAGHPCIHLLHRLKPEHSACVALVQLQHTSASPKLLFIYIYSEGLQFFLVQTEAIAVVLPMDDLGTVSAERFVWEFLGCVRISGLNG